jgi:hypothetical protein
MKSSLRRKSPPPPDEFPGIEAGIPDLPLDALVPRARVHSMSEVHFDGPDIVHYIDLLLGGTGGGGNNNNSNNDIDYSSY